MPNHIKELLQQYVNEIHDIYGKALKTVILYSSYARGDFNDSSDVDILIMPIAKNSRHFQYWLPAYPFYENVRSEGVELYVA